MGVVAWALATGVHGPESVVLGSIYGAFTYGTALCLGVPFFALSLRKGWTQWWQYAIAGALLGLAPMLVLSIAAQRPPSDWRTWFVFVGVGVLSATVFWCVAFGVRRK